MIYAYLVNMCMFVIVMVTMCQCSLLQEIRSLHLVNKEIKKENLHILLLWASITSLSLLILTMIDFNIFDDF